MRDRVDSPLLMIFFLQLDGFPDDELVLIRNILLT